MEEFKIGQDVYSSERGAGEVTRVVDYTPYSVWALFETGKEDFTKEGLRSNCAIHPSLFHSLQDYKEYVANIKEPKKPTKVDVWLNIYPIEIISHTSKKDADDLADKGRLECFHFCKEYEVEE